MKDFYLKEREIQLTVKEGSAIYDGEELTSSDNAAKAFRTLYDHDILVYESFYAIYMDQKNKIIGFRRISQGSSSATIVDVKMIVKTALDVGAQSVIVAHNHPSGNTKPSSADIKISNKISKALDLFDIRMLDSLIITKNDYLSMNDEGLL